MKRVLKVIFPPPIPHLTSGMVSLEWVLKGTRIPAKPRLIGSSFP
jgi:hypothetical protein